MSERRRIDWGVVLFLGLLLAVPATGYLLYTLIAEPSVERPDIPELRQLERDLAAAQRELAEMRKAARMDTQPEVQAMWRTSLAEQQAKVDACQARIEDYLDDR